MTKYLISFFCCVTIWGSTYSQYTISGSVNIGEDWQPKVYLAAINKLSDYYRTSPDIIVNTAAINPDGTFELQGDNLPKQPQFYRLYLMKTQNTDYDACLYVGGDDHNFAHLILGNGDHVEIHANPNSVAPFGDYSVVGNSANLRMRDLAQIVFPSFYFYRIKFPTELKFSEDKLNEDLKHFADTCSNPLVAMAAVNNTDFDAYFDRDREFYESFGERLQAKLPKSIYTKNYLLKLKYYANEGFTFPIWSLILFGVLVLGLLFSLGKISALKNKIESIQKGAGLSPKNDLDLEQILTQKEFQILKLLEQGKSNKEVAAALFVELSTVKSHINKIYSKIGVNNRKDALSVLKTANSVGV